MTSILVDNRAGSKELAPLLPKAKTQLTRLDFGDVAWIGHGPKGDQFIGLEHKTIGDVINCIMDGRFAAHQLPGLIQTYDYSYLMVEGRIKQDQHHLLWWFHEKTKKWIQPYGGSQRKPMSWEGFHSWLQTMSIQGGIQVLCTETKKQSAQTIKALVKWWSKPWAKHESLKVFNETQRIVLPLTKVSTRRLMIAQVPGIGWEKSQDLARAFPTVLDMCLATEADWRAIPGIGKELAARLVRELQGS